MILAAGCTKSTPKPPVVAQHAIDEVASQEVAHPLADPCSAEGVQQDLSALKTQESNAKKLEVEAKATPAKENFKKLYASEIDLKARGEEVLKRWNACKSPVLDSSLQELKKMIASAKDSVTYLADSFPDLR